MNRQMQKTLNCNNTLSQNAESEGFDIVAGSTWIYPTNLPVRDYQLNIVKEALFKNTMVSLPTGLGKTFLASVIMYNYYRWYPHGKIIFMAPTRPLVKQQMEACYNIMGLPKDQTSELTGNTNLNARNEIWDKKRVFFITPQVLQNDLDRIAKLGKQIKCLVFDEAHKARGNHAYCEVIRRLVAVNCSFRVLALTATPGSYVTDVIKVCSDLLISHLEIRTEECGDVAPYTFKKNIETVVVPLTGKLREVHEEYIRILDVYARTLVQHKVIQGNCSTLTKGRLFFLKKEYEESRKPRHPAHNEIMRNLNICFILYHALEVLTKHGLRGFLSFFEDHSEKPLLRHIGQIKALMQKVDNYLGPKPDIDMLPDGSVPEIPASTKFGHPKLYKLSEVLNKHLSGESGSKAIVFCEYKESIYEVYAMLLTQRPLVKPKMFLGQSTITARQQNNIVEDFRNGVCNTLISTSIGEEGLDIGDVNLVVCFDIFNKSALRMIQRTGRTGRKKDGHVIMLVSEGREQQLLQQSLVHKDHMINVIMKSKELTANLYKNSPRMVPSDIVPKLEMMKMTVVKTGEKEKGVRYNSLKNMFQRISMDNVTAGNGPIVDLLPVQSNELLYKMSVELFYNCEDKEDLSFDCTQGEIIKSSATAEAIKCVNERADLLKYNIPDKLNKELQSKSPHAAIATTLKQMDLKSMLFNHHPSSIIQSTQVPETFNHIMFRSLQIELHTFIRDDLYEDENNNGCLMCRNECGLVCRIFCGATSDCDELSSFEYPSDEVIERALGKEKLARKSGCADDFLDDDFQRIIEDLRSKVDDECNYAQNEVELCKREDLESLKDVVDIGNDGACSKLHEESRLNQAKTHETSKNEVKTCTREELEALKDFVNIDELFMSDDESKANKSKSNVESKSNAPIVTDKAKVACEIFESPSKSFVPLPRITSVEDDDDEELTIDDYLDKEYDALVMAENVDLLEDEHGTWVVKGSKNLLNKYKAMYEEKDDEKIIEYTESEKISKLTTLYKSTLKFFQLDSIDDLFDLSTKPSDRSSPPINVLSSDDDSPILASFGDARPIFVDEKITSAKKQLDFNVSPDIFENQSNSSDECMSPILSQNRKRPLENNAKSDCFLGIFPIPAKPQAIDANITAATSADVNTNVRNKEPVETTKATKNDSPEDLFDDDLFVPQTQRLNFEATKVTNSDDDFEDEFFFSSSGKRKRSKDDEMPSKKFCKPVKKNNHKGDIRNNDSLDVEDFLTDLRQSKVGMLKTQKEIVPKCAPKIMSSKTNETFDVEDFLTDLSQKNTHRASTCAPKHTSSNIVKSISNTFDVEDFLTEIDQNRPTTKDAKKTSNTISSRNDNLVDVDDFFTELTQKNEPAKINFNDTQTEVNKIFNLNDSSDDEATRPHKQTNKRNVFVNDEAEYVSSDTDDEEAKELDVFEESFMDDAATQQEINESAMHAHYLKTVRSPLKNGGFKIPELPRKINASCFSQKILDDSENTYLEDSFCVDSDDDETNMNQTQNLSELEIAEMMLKIKRREKRLNKQSNERKRIIVIDDSDSD